MKVLWFAWKDMAHPWAGGAEVVGTELRRRLVADGHEVRLVTAGFSGGAAQATADGVAITRLGNRWSVYWLAYLHYRRHLVGWADVVIDEMNTIPFFCRLYVREPNLMFVHQLCREIWLYQMRFPMSVVGWLAEPLYLRLLSGSRAVTVSESTRADLARFGFRRERIAVIPQGISCTPIADLAEVPSSQRESSSQQPASSSQRKLGSIDSPVLLAFGTVRTMKRTHHAVLAFNLAKRTLPGLKLVIAGEMAESGYPGYVRRLVAQSPYAADIIVRGAVTADEKLALMRDASLILATPVKEGWGLTVSEAASQGTPAVAYDVDGLRDSVRDGETGIVVRSNTPAALAAAVIVLLGDATTYDRYRRRGLELARAMTFDRAYAAFLVILRQRH